MRRKYIRDGYGERAFSTTSSTQQQHGYRSGPRASPRRLRTGYATSRFGSANPTLPKQAMRQGKQSISRLEPRARPVASRGARHGSRHTAQHADALGSLGPGQPRTRSLRPHPPVPVGTKKGLEARSAHGPRPHPELSAYRPAKPGARSSGASVTDTVYASS
jgi:hypothetical protein